MFKEKLYVYANSSQISSQTGLIGHLRADMDTNGKGFFSSWWPYRKDLITDEFKTELDKQINELRQKDFLKDRTALTKWCYSHIEQSINDREWGFRIDTGKYTFLLRVNPNRGEYNMYCYCYIREWLDKHIKNAEKGIRFINSNYKELFRIQDGGAFKVSYPDGSEKTESARYIDEYHMEIHDNVYHICQYAEIMERNEARAEAI